MPHADGHTEGIYFGPRDLDLPDEFKNVFKHRRDPFSMSGEMRHAMRMHMTVQTALNAAAIDSQFEAEGRDESREAEARKREWVRKAILEKAERDFGRPIDRSEHPDPTLSNSD